jgi:hypothetical protein
MSTEEPDVPGEEVPENPEEHDEDVVEEDADE